MSVSQHAPVSITGTVSRSFRHPTSFFSYRRTMWLTVALLMAVTALALFHCVTVIRLASPRDQYLTWLICSLLVSLAISVLLLGRYMTQRVLQQIEKQLRTLTSNDDGLEAIQAPVPDDLRPVITALAEYVAKVRQRVAHLRLRQKELDIQMRVADAERRHTEAVITSISDAVLVVDPSGNLVLANTAAEALFGFCLSESRTLPIARVLKDATLVTLLKTARTSPLKYRRRQLDYSTTRNNRTQTFNITLSTVIDADDEIRGLVAVFHDVTREREIAQIKTDFVSSVSHELRTPLSSIKAYVEMLNDDEAHDRDERFEFYRIIESETDRLQRLISNILNISRIESGVMEIKREAVDVNTLTHKVHKSLSPQAGEKNISLNINAQQDLPRVRADKDLIHQAIINVISNAIKYTRPGGEVTVSTTVDMESRRLIITVADNGIGIRAEDLPRVFDKFFRSRESRDVAKGTGLGLNLVKHIVETVHQGHISLTSELGVGTTIALCLPMMAR